MRPIFAVLWVFVLVILLPSSGVRVYATTIAFYSDAVIKEGDVYDNVEVHDTPPAHTTLDLYGQIDGNVILYDASTLDFVFPGSIRLDLVASGASTVNIRQEGGMPFPSLSLSSFSLWQSSTGNIFSGFVGALTLAQGSSTVNVYAGNLNGLHAYDGSTLNIYGGEIGTGWGCSVNDEATANIYGYAFEYDPQAWWDGSGRISDGWVSELTGFGPGGIPIRITGISDPSTNPNIRLIPEPCTVVLLGLGVVGLLGKRSVDRNDRMAGGWLCLNDECRVIRNGGARRAISFLA
jgi:hypothetical protein